MVGGWRGVGSEAELAESGRLGTFRRRHRVAGQRGGCGHCPRRGGHTRSGGERPRLSLWNPGQSPAQALRQPAVGRPFLVPPRAPSSPVVPRGWPDGRAGSDECPLGCQGTSDSAPLGSGGPGVPGSALQRRLRPPRASEPKSTLTRAPELCVRMGSRDMGSKASLGFLR